METLSKQLIVAACDKLPSDCRFAPATESQLEAFESEFGAIPPDYRWYISACGGGVCGSEWLDGIEQLVETHRKFRQECDSEGWTMKDVFVIGWDGAGNPFGIHPASGKILIEDHNFGGIHEMADSFEAFLLDRLKASA